jgi:hypothetical protein
VCVCVCVCVCVFLDLTSSVRCADWKLVVAGTLTGVNLSAVQIIIDLFLSSLDPFPCGLRKNY